MNPQLQDYIKKSREAGFSDEQIKQELRKVGWQEEVIIQELIDASTSTPMPNPAFVPKSKSKLPIIILVVAIVILLIAGGVFGYIYLIKPTTSENVTENQNDTLNNSNNIVSENNSASQVDIQHNSDNTVRGNNSVPQIKDCGLIKDAKTILDLPDPYTNVGYYSAFKCMQEALLNNCQPAKLGMTNEANGTIADVLYEIKGEKERNCLFSVEIVNLEKPSICRVALNKILELKAENEANQHNDANFFEYVTYRAVNDDPRVVCE